MPALPASTGDPIIPRRTADQRAVGQRSSKTRGDKHRDQRRPKASQKQYEKSACTRTSARSALHLRPRDERTEQSTHENRFGGLTVFRKGSKEPRLKSRRPRSGKNVWVFQYYWRKRKKCKCYGVRGEAQHSLFQENHRDRKVCFQGHKEHPMAAIVSTS